MLEPNSEIWQLENQTTTLFTHFGKTYWLNLAKKERHLSAFLILRENSWDFSEMIS